MIILILIHAIISIACFILALMSVKAYDGFVKIKTILFIFLFSMIPIINVIFPVGMIYFLSGVTTGHTENNEL